MKLKAWLNTVFLLIREGSCVVLCASWRCWYDLGYDCRDVATSWACCWGVRLTWRAWNSSYKCLSSLTGRQQLVLTLLPKLQHSVLDLWCMLWINYQRMVAEGKSRHQHIKQMKKSNICIVRLSSTSYFSFYVVYHTINLNISELGWSDGTWTTWMLFFLGVDRKIGDLINRNCPVPLEAQVNYWTYEISQIF